MASTVAGLALSVALATPAFSYTTDRSSAPVDPGYSPALVAQLSYQGYLECDEMRSRNCEIELNRRKSSVKELCYSIWTGNWPERSQLDPATIRMYIEWCNEAREDVKFAAREFSPLIQYVSKYRKFDVEKSSPEEVVNAALNTQYFLDKCSSKSAQRSAQAMELWGTKQHGSWVIPDLQQYSPTRYSEVLTACDKKSWSRGLLEKTRPVLASAWGAQQQDVVARSCAAPVSPARWTPVLLSQQESTLKQFDQFLKQTSLVKEMQPSPISMPGSELEAFLSDLKLRAGRCKELVALGSSDIKLQEQEAERARQLQAAREAEQARREAAARAERERRAAAERAAAAQRDAAARAAEAARQRKQAERRQIMNSVELN